MSEKAIFAAGCFWGVEDAFRRKKGVLSAVSGYSGGTVANPSYEQVCTGKTGHAESVQVTYDPNEVSYQELLSLFWSIHDPTTLNRQGPDVGSQYRSVIFCGSPEQEAEAKQSKENLIRSGKPAVTQIVPASTFYPAEEYHQRYFEKHGSNFCGH